MRWALLLLTGCISATSLGHEAANGALDAAQERLPQLAVTTMASARDEGLGPATEARVVGITAAARNEAVGPETEKRVSTIITIAGSSARVQRDAFFDAVLLADVAKVREELFGAPLRLDLAQLLAAAEPQIADIATHTVTAAVSPIKTSADEEATTWRNVALGLGVGASVLLLVLLFALYEVRTHRKMIEKLLSKA